MQRKILRLEDYRQTECPPTGGAYRVQRHGGGKDLCRAIVAAAETVTTLMIGIGFLFCAVLVITML